MKRFILMLTVSSLLAAMVALSVGVASAAVGCPEPGPDEVACMGEGSQGSEILPSTFLPGGLPSKEGISNQLETPQLPSVPSEEVVCQLSVEGVEFPGCFYLTS